MKIKSPEFADAVRAALLKMTEDRHVVGYYTANVLLAVVMRAPTVGLQKNREYELLTSQDGYRWAYRSRKHGHLLIASMCTELTTEEAAMNGGSFYTDLNQHEVKTLEVHHTPLESAAHELMWKSLNRHS